MDNFKELALVKANFISEMEEYKKNCKKLLSGLLKKYNLHKDCEWDGKVGQFRIVENRHSCIRPCEIAFYTYTKKGELSKKSTAWIGFNPFDTDKDFERFITIEGIKAVEGSSDEDSKTD